MLTASFLVCISLEYIGHLRVSRSWGLISMSRSQNGGSALVCAALGHSLITSLLWFVRRRSTSETRREFEPIRYLAVGLNICRFLADSPLHPGNYREIRENAPLFTYISVVFINKLNVNKLIQSSRFRPVANSKYGNSK